jgi:DNA invertase Pin-like site-specific DNA recombinase
MRVALYARVSTEMQTTDNQLVELRRYAEARGWAVHQEYTDHISGSKESRPALDAMLKDAKRRRFDAVVCWRLDRLGRNLRHLILLLDELQALGVSFVSLAEGIDATTPAGKLQLHILGAIAEFERGRIRERVMAGLARAKAQGKRLGRPISAAPVERLAAVAHLPHGRAAQALGISKTTIKEWRRRAGKGAGNPPSRAIRFRPETP